MPDIVRMMNEEKENALKFCEKLEAKYGKAEFGKPVSEEEMQLWETKNHISIPEDYKAWLRFSGESKLKGISLTFFPPKRFQVIGDYVAIGKRENADIGFLIENGRYIAIEKGNRKNLGYMETILRFWYYDAKELFAEEELEALRPVIEKEMLKMEAAKQAASAPDAGVKEAMEYFFGANNVAYLKKWRCYPHCPVRKDRVNCELIISEPDHDGYYQWQPVAQTEKIDFAEIEAKLGFQIHADIKNFVSGYFFFMLEAVLENGSFHIYPILPVANMERNIISSFDKESYAGDYDFILNGQFFSLGGACIEGDDSYQLEVNNETGEVLAVEYMDKTYIKIADSLYELFMNARPIWAE